MTSPTFDLFILEAAAVSLSLYKLVSDFVLPQDRVGPLVRGVGAVRAVRRRLTMLHMSNMPAAAVKAPALEWVSKFF